MNITLEELKLILTEQNKIFDEIDLEKKFHSINQEEIFDKLNSLFTLIEWDKKSKINGVESKTILESIEIPTESNPYLIESEGKVIFFQWHKPFVEGIVPIKNALEEGQEHLNLIIKELMIQNLLNILV